MWILQVEVADLVMSLIVLKVSTQTTSMTLIIRGTKAGKEVIIMTLESVDGMKEPVPLTHNT